MVDVGYRALYTEGLSAAEREAAGNWLNHPESQRAVRIFRFWREELTWAYTNRDGEVFALEDGTMGSACLVLLDKDSGRKAPASLYSNTTIGIPATFIAPQPVTVRWSGVVLFHEIGHLYDLVHGGESWDPPPDEWFEGEARAYRSQIALVDAMEGGALLNAVDQLLQEHPDRSRAQWLASMDQLTSRLDGALKFRTPASQSERGQREAFYCVALLFRLSARERLDPASQRRRDRTDLEAVAAYC